MPVYCQIVDEPNGFVGIIVDATSRAIVFQTDLCGCAEAADGEMERIITNRRYTVVDPPGL